MISPLAIPEDRGNGIIRPNHHSHTHPTLAELNVGIWLEQKLLMEQRMGDRAILEIAIETIAFETRRCVPVRNQMSFEKALEDRLTSAARL